MLKYRLRGPHHTNDDLTARAAKVFFNMHVLTGVFKDEVVGPLLSNPLELFNLMLKFMLKIEIKLLMD